jgi:hypothetical protein
MPGVGKPATAQLAAIACALGQAGTVARGKSITPYRQFVR